jgi:hypothetical protein
MKIVINADYGGFGLSYTGVMLYAKKKGFDLYAYVDDRNTSYENRRLIPYNDKEIRGLIYYFREPLIDGKYDKQTSLCHWDIDRDDPALVEVVEELGSKSWGDYAKLEVREIPDGINWIIEEYDGNEWIAEEHRIW